MQAITSRISYRTEQGTFQLQKLRILDCLKMSPALSNREIAIKTGLEIGAVCGRSAEMSKAGVIEHGPKKTCPITNKIVQTWQLPQEMGQLLLWR